MKNTINSTLRVVLAAAFFCTAAFADGDMSNGGKSCPSTGCPQGIIVIAPPTADSNDSAATENDDSVLSFVNDLLARIGVI